MINKKDEMRNLLNFTDGMHRASMDRFAFYTDENAANHYVRSIWTEKAICEYERILVENHKLLWLVMAKNSPFRPIFNIG